MDNVNTLRHLIINGNWMVKLGLKDAYLTVPVYEGHQKCLQFLWEGKDYQYVCLPFNLASAQWKFTKILKPVFAHPGMSTGHLFGWPHFIRPV